MIEHGQTMREMAKALGRTEHAVAVRISKLGWWEAMEQRVKRPGDESSVQCPFFLSMRPGRRICCEAPLQGAKLAVLFESEAMWRAHVAQLCDDEFLLCPVAKMLWERYE